MNPSSNMKKDHFAITFEKKQKIFRIRHTPGRTTAPPGEWCDPVCWDEPTKAAPQISVRLRKLKPLLRSFMFFLNNWEHIKQLR